MKPGTYKVYRIHYASSEYFEGFFLDINDDWTIIGSKDELARRPMWSKYRAYEKYMDLLWGLFDMLKEDDKMAQLEFTKQAKNKIPKRLEGLAEERVEVHNKQF